jgi:hypothetical protein
MISGPGQTAAGVVSPLGLANTPLLNGTAYPPGHRRSSSISTSVSEISSPAIILEHDDLSRINDILINYSHKLSQFAAQFWKGNAKFQKLANDLHNKIVELQLNITEAEGDSEVSIAAVRHLVREFEHAFTEHKHSGLIESAGLLVNRILLGPILSEFREKDAPRLSIILLKFEKGYVDYNEKMARLGLNSRLRDFDLIEFIEMRFDPLDLINSKEVVRRLKEYYPDADSVAEIEDKFSSCDTTKLLDRLKGFYAIDGLTALDIFHQEYNKLYSKFVDREFSPLNPGQWLPVAFEITQLLQMAVLVTPLDSRDREFAEKLHLKLTAIQRARPYNLLIPFVEDSLFFDLNEALLDMKQTLFSLLKVNLQPTKQLEELYSRTVMIEQGHIDLSLSGAANLKTKYIRQVTQALIRKRLIAVYNFCYFYQNTMVSVVFEDNIRKDMQNRFDQVQALAKKIDISETIYQQFLTNKEFEKIHFAFVELQLLLKKFMGQFWKGNALWQESAQALAGKLEKFQKIIADDHAHILQRLGYAHEAMKLIDAHITFRVGDDLASLTEASQLTTTLQSVNVEPYLNRISIKDIFVNYRAKAEPIIIQSMLNITNRLSAEDKRNFEHQRNFREIYCLLNAYAKDYLDDYITNTPGESELVGIARELMTSLDARSQRIKNNYVLSDNVAECVKESESVKHDFNRAIVSYMRVYHRNAQTSHFYADVLKTQFVDKIRDLIKDMTPTDVRPHDFMQRVFKKLNAFPDAASIMLSNGDAQAALATSNSFMESSIAVLEDVIQKIPPCASLYEIKKWERTRNAEVFNQVVAYAKHYYPDPIVHKLLKKDGTPIADPTGAKRQRLIDETEALKKWKRERGLVAQFVINNLKKILPTIFKRIKAQVSIKEAADKFLAGGSKAELMKVAYQLIREQPISHSTATVNYKLKQEVNRLYHHFFPNASGLNHANVGDAKEHFLEEVVKLKVSYGSEDVDDYLESLSKKFDEDMLYEEQLCIREFMHLVLNSSLDFSSLAGILAHFKREDESILNAYVARVKHELPPQRIATLQAREEALAVNPSRPAVTVTDTNSLDAISLLRSESISNGDAGYDSLNHLLRSSDSFENKEAKSQPINGISSQSALKLFPNFFGSEDLPQQPQLSFSTTLERASSHKVIQSRELSFAVSNGDCFHPPQQNGFKHDSNSSEMTKVPFGSSANGSHSLLYFKPVTSVPSPLQLSQNGGPEHQNDRSRNDIYRPNGGG